MTNSIFVYGTLKSGGPARAHRLLGPAKLLGRGSVRGTLYHLGRYPALVREGSDDRRVFGELYELPSASAQNTLRALDDYEGAEFERRRLYVTLSNGRKRAAWTYLLRRGLPKTARRIQSGRFDPRRGAA
jgi:gamma-glutamylcyclotransferase (GGCT)/AIG2-like uncharacterized protein YtfP